MYKVDKFGFLIAYSFIRHRPPILHVSRHIKLLIHVVDGWFGWKYFKHSIQPPKSFLGFYDLLLTSKINKPGTRYI